MTGLDDAPGGRPNHFARATTRRWWIRRSWQGSSASEPSMSRARSTSWSAPATASGTAPGDARSADVRRGEHRFWGFLPYEKYVFLLLFRPGGGGLEHSNSNLSTVLRSRGRVPTARPRRRMAVAEPGAPGARILSSVQREAAASDRTRSLQFREAAEDGQPVDIRRRDVLLQRPADDARRAADAGEYLASLSRSSAVCRIRPAACCSRWSIRRSRCGRTATRASSQGEHRELLHQGRRARPAARREDPPRDRRPREPRRCDAAGVPALRRRARIHGRRVSTDDRRSGRH